MSNVTVQEAFRTWYKSKYYKYDIYPKYHQFRVEVEDAFIQGYKDALAEIEKCEPVKAKQTPFNNCQFEICDLPGQCRGEGKCHHPAYTSPQPRDWVELSDSEWVNIVNHHHAYDSFTKDDAVHYAVKATEAKLTQLNTKG